MTKSTKSIKQRQRSRWTGGEDEARRDTKHGTLLNLELGLNEEDKAE